MSHDETVRTAAFAAVAEAHDHFGGLDIVVNNAGYGQFGMIEEISEQEARAQIETDVFGALWVTRAAPPFLRETGGGHILQVASIGGISAFADIGVYNASKWALEGVEPGAHGRRRQLRHHNDPDRAGCVLHRPIGLLDRPRDAAARVRRGPRTRGGAAQEARGQPGKPTVTSDAVLAVVDAEKTPLRIFLGDRPLAIATADYESRLAEWREWESVSVAPHAKAG